MTRPSRIAIVKELGARTPRCLAAHAVSAANAANGTDETELVIVERYPATLGADVLAVIEEDAKALVGVEHPNLASLISTAKLKGDVAVLSEWVDGESLATVLASPDKVPVEVLLRALLDVLDGLTALHAAKAPTNANARVTGPFTPEDVFVGVDGVTRLTRFGLGRVAANLLGARRARYAAPELAKGDHSVRGDVFTAGLVLRECLTGELPDDTATPVDPQKLALPALASVIDKALASDPGARYASASELSSAVTGAGAKVAPRAAVSQYIARAFGERIAARLARLEPKGGDLPFSINAPPTTTPPPAVQTVQLKVAEVAPVEVKAPPAPPEPAPVVKPADKPSDPKPFPDSSGRLPTAAARKPSASTPDAVGATLARKAVPLPKRTLQEPLPTLTQVGAKPSTTKVNGNAAHHVTVEAKPATKAIAKPSPVKAEQKADTPKAVAKTNPEPAPTPDPPPPSARDEIDVDVDLVSVRPPPIEARLRADTPKGLPSAKRKEAPPPPAPADESAPVREPVPAKTAKTPNVQEAREQQEEEEQPVPRQGSRTVLLFGIGIVLFASGFLVGRFTSPETSPPPVATTPEPTPTPTQTSSALPTVTAATATSTVTATDRPTATARVTTVAPPLESAKSATSASKVDASRYDPNGI